MSNYNNTGSSPLQSKTMVGSEEAHELLSCDPKNTHGTHAETKIKGELMEYVVKYLDW